MRLITLNEYLSSNNKWTNRLLGRNNFQKERNAELVKETYNQDIWKKQLDDFNANPSEFIKKISTPSDKEWVISLREELFCTPLFVYESIRYSYIMRFIEKYGHKSKRICELGCGFGRNLFKLNKVLSKELYGGDYSENAVELGNKLGLDIRFFDYYKDDSYSIIKDNSTVITVHSLEQIPDATTFISSMRKIKSKVDAVIHIEPIYNENRTSLLGVMRNRYAEINDYNRNLLDLLNDAKDIEVIHKELDLLGINPLNPSSVIVWRFD